MKLSAEEWEGEELDKHLFDYLEANLPEEQTIALEQALASDAVLAGELDLWREALVSSGYPDTHLLEEKLLISIPSVTDHRHSLSAGSATSLLVVVLFTGICCLWPVKVEKNISAAIQPLPLPAVVLENTTTAPVTQVRLPEHIPAIHLSRQYPDAEAKTVVPLPNGRMLPEPFSPLLPLSLPVDTQISRLTIPAGANKKTSLKNLPITRVSSRKQARQIARMKERALQQRKANEFLKGRVPYVVPLNTRNF
jgi:hypothetical protein